MKFQIYKEGLGIGQYRWRLVATNGKIIADSGESYHNKTDCLKGIDLVKSTNVFTPVQHMAV